MSEPSPLLLRIGPAGSVPPYEQIRVQIVERIGSGELAPGARLPTVRRLAADLGVAANTVARSYRELEQDGVVETRGRAGTFVAHTGDATRRAARADAQAYAARIERLGLPPEEGLRLAARALGLPDRGAAIGPRSRGRTQ